MDEAERQTHDMERDLPEGAEDERWSVDETSRRIANLLFLFTTTRRPVPTRDIVCDSDLGYGSGNVESDMRKFRRDRDALARRGCFIVQAGAHAAAENEESSWELDRKRTYASVPSLPADDLILLIRAIDIELEGDHAPYRHRVHQVRATLKHVLIAAGGAADGAYAGPEADGATAVALWSAFAAGKRARFQYRNAAGERREREVEQYGFFTRGDTSYMVGRDVLKDGCPVRTFNLDRVEQVRAPKGSYTVPEDFDVKSYLVHPFEIGGGTSEGIAFLIPASFARGEVGRITMGKGSLEDVGEEGWLWRVQAADVEAAARFSIEQGIVPVAPEELVSCWNDIVQKAVDANEP